MMLSRSEDLCVVEGEYARRLWRNLSRRGWKLKEPLDDQLPVEKPRLLRRAFELLIREGVQTRAQIREALPYALSDIEELAGLPHHFLEEEPAPVNLKAFERKGYRSVREQPIRPADVVEFRPAGDGNNS